MNQQSGILQSPIHLRESAVFFSIFCVLAPLLLLFAFIWLQTLALRKGLNYPVKNTHTVPIPSPPPPRPYKNKSFAQLADELEKSFTKIR